MPTHVALYSVVNEFEECRSQALTLTKSLSYIEGCYTGIAESLQKHGHKETKLMFSDNARAERAFHEACTPSLKKDVVHIKSDRYANLPALELPQTPIIYLYHADLIDETCLHLLEKAGSNPTSHLVAGVAFEYEVDPDGQGGLIPRHGNSIDTVQISVFGNVYVFKITHLKSQTSAPPNLVALLASQHIVKTGYSIHRDLKRIADLWSISDLHHQLKMKNTSSIIDLGVLAKTKGVISDNRAPLETLVGSTLSHSLNRSNALILSEWSSFDLSQEQINFAGLNAYASFRIWQVLSTEESVGLVVRNSIPGTLVDIRGGKKIVAQGKIAEQPSNGVAAFQYAMDTKKINITPTRVVVQVDKILIPGYEPALHKMALQDMGHPPFLIVTNKSMITTRKLNDPENTSTDMEGTMLPDNITSYAPPPALTPAMINELPLSLDEDSDEVEEEFGHTASHKQPEGSNSDEEYDDPEFNALIENADLSDLSTTGAPAASNAFVQPDSITPTNLPSRTLEDIWHVKERLLKLLPEAHSAFKPFKAAFGQAIFVYDKTDRENVEKVLQKNGEKWDVVLRTKTAMIHKRVRRYVPPPDILCPVLKTLFDCWKDVPCSLNPANGPLFSPTAWKQAQNTLKSAREGLISDPPGIALYYKIGIDTDGLVYYRTCRGTNSVEGGIHMPLRRTFGSLHASPELSDGLLCNARDRRNTSIGYFNRTGKKWAGHYDAWKTDEIAELAADVGLSPTFPTPDILATRIATTESFGIIPVPKQILNEVGMRSGDPVTNIDSQAIIPTYRGSSVHILTRLSTKPLSAYSFLAQSQKTAFAVVPVHTTAEYQLFTQLLKSGTFHIMNKGKQPSAAHASKSVDFMKMAKEWAVHVHILSEGNQTLARHEKIYYKLPEQLEKHHQNWVKSRGEVATLSNSEQMRGKFTSVISNPNRQAQVLPAVELIHPIPKATKTDKGKRREIVTGMYKYKIECGLKLTRDFSPTRS